jgi:hypothetical protein
MNAQLRPILQSVISRPAYVNTNVAKFWKWERDNVKALQSYYEALGAALPEPDDSMLTGLSRGQNYLSFAHVQWDRERTGL